MKKYALAGALFAVGAYTYLWQSAPVINSGEPTLARDAPGAASTNAEESTGVNLDAVTRQEAKLLAGAPLKETPPAVMADDVMSLEMDADAVPPVVQRERRALGEDLNAEDVFDIPSRSPKAMGPDLDPEDLSIYASRLPQRLGRDIDVEAYETMVSKRDPQSLGDDIDVGDQNP